MKINDIMQNEPKQTSTGDTMRYVNYRIANGELIGYGGQHAAIVHPDLETAQKRLKAYLRSPWKGNDTKDTVATAEEQDWVAKYHPNLRMR